MDAPNYCAHWGLARLPFQNVPDPSFFCPLPQYEGVLARLAYVIDSGAGGAVLTGEPGCGKSTLSRVFVTRLDESRDDVGLVINTSFPAEELLAEIGLQLGVPLPGSHRSALFPSYRPGLVRTLHEHLLANARAGRRTVVLLDEAHTIKSDAVLEDLRMLMNFQLNDRNLLTLILLGLPGLRETLGEHEAFSQRLAVRLRLDPLFEEDTTSYVRFRLAKAGAGREIFTEGALKTIYGETGGIPRKINTLCGLCLFEGARRTAREIDIALVKAALACT